MLGFVVALASLFALEIHAAGGCPGAGEIERQLAPLLGTEARTSDVATVTHAAGGAFVVSLADARGGAIEERRLPPAGTCRDGAETIAVTLAIWEAQIHPEISLRLDQLSPEATTPTIVAAAPRPVRTRTTSLGVAVGGDVQAGEGAPAGRVALSYGRQGGRLRARLAAVGVGRHTIDVGPGSATWWRAFLALGVEGDVLRGRRWAIAVGAAATGGVAAISGSGFAVNRGTHSLEVGGEASLRGLLRTGPVQPWLGVSAVGWLRRQDLELQGVTTSSALPRWEPMAALGADFVW
jgi:hypothetical protein